MKNEIRKTNSPETHEPQNVGPDEMKRSILLLVPDTDILERVPGADFRSLV